MQRQHRDILRSPGQFNASLAAWSDVRLGTSVQCPCNRHTWNNLQFQHPLPPWQAMLPEGGPGLQPINPAPQAHAAASLLPDRACQAPHWSGSVMLFHTSAIESLPIKPCFKGHGILDIRDGSEPLQCCVLHGHLPYQIQLLCKFRVRE